MDRIKKVEMAVERIQNGYFGHMRHWTSDWTSGGYTSVAISSVLNDDVYHKTQERDYPKRIPHFYELLELAHTNGKDLELIPVDKKLFEKIEKIVPEVAKKLMEVVTFLKPLAETRK